MPGDNWVEKHRPVKHHCPDCGVEYDSVGTHLGKSSCQRPMLSGELKEISKGLLLGDAWIQPSGYMVIQNTQFEFLDWLIEKFGWLVSGVQLIEDDVPEHKKSGWLRFTTHQYFRELRNWYETGEKLFPDDLALTPEAARMWYVCDGGIYEGARSWDIRIYTENSTVDSGYVDELFSDTPLSPAYYSSSHGAIRFGAGDREAFLEWLGEPITGFEYKWRQAQ